jgi:hypothetical protein
MSFLKVDGCVRHIMASAVTGHVQFVLDMSHSASFKVSITWQVVQISVS